MKFDISKNFYISNNDISKINEAAVFTEALKNILSIEPGESSITELGCALKKYQFTQVDTFNARLLMKEIEKCIYKFNREAVEEAIVKVSPKRKTDSFDVEIWVKLNNIDDIINVNKSLSI